MAQVSPFSSPLLPGFDRLRDVLDRLARSQADGARLEGGLPHIEPARPTMPGIVKTVPIAGAGGAGG